jgi:hypothetical protein
MGPQSCRMSCSSISRVSPPLDYRSGWFRPLEGQSGRMYSSADRTKPSLYDSATLCRSFRPYRALGTAPLCQPPAFIGSHFPPAAIDSRRTGGKYFSETCQLTKRQPVINSATPGHLKLQHPNSQSRSDNFVQELTSPTFS